MRKVFLILMLLIITFLSICQITSFAETSAPQILVGYNQGKFGETIEIPITITGNSGFSSLGIEITYDKTALRLINTIAGNTGCYYTSAPNYSTVPYNMCWDSITNSSYNGVLRILVFEVITEETGEFPVTVDFYKGRNSNYKDGININYDENFLPLNLRYSSGCVDLNIEDAKMSVKIKAGEKTYNAEFDVLKGGGNIYAALYSEDKKLKSITPFAFAKQIEVNADDAENGDFIKLLWWSSLNEQIPMNFCKTIEIK